MTLPRTCDPPPDPSDNTWPQAEPGYKWPHGDGVHSLPRTGTPPPEQGAPIGGYPLRTTVAAEPHLCPVCQGRQTVPRGFYGRQATTNADDQTCRTCDGKGVLWR